MRLIDADILSNAMYRKSFETDDGRQRWDGGLWIRYKVFEEARDKAPTIDAVPVVRCNDCEHWDTDWETGDEPVTHFCAMVALRTRGDWFCADGERKAEP